jgi:hypothetical protein
MTHRQRKDARFRAMVQGCPQAPQSLTKNVGLMLVLLAGPPGWLLLYIFLAV